MSLPLSSCFLLSSSFLSHSFVLFPLLSSFNAAFVSFPPLTHIPSPFFPSPLTLPPFTLALHSPHASHSVSPPLTQSPLIIISPQSPLFLSRFPLVSTSFPALPSFVPSFFASFASPPLTSTPSRIPPFLSLPLGHVYFVPSHRKRAWAGSQTGVCLEGWGGGGNGAHLPLNSAPHLYHL